MRVKFGNLVSVLWVGRGSSEWEGWERDTTGFHAVPYLQVAPPPFANAAMFSAIILQGSQLRGRPNRSVHFSFIFSLSP